MNTLSPVIYFRKQTLVILFVCLACLASLALYARQPVNSHPHDLICRAALKIVHDDNTFRGIVDIKAGDDKGIVNINGTAMDATGKESIVQRTILFTHANYGPSLIWRSQQILISNRENAPTALVQAVLPDFYLKQTGVSDIDLFTLNKNGWLITKEGVPYLYCRSYELEPEE